jgi:hypothetical protein
MNLVKIAVQRLNELNENELNEKTNSVLTETGRSGTLCQFIEDAAVRCLRRGVSKTCRRYHGRVAQAAMVWKISVLFAFTRKTLHSAVWQGYYRCARNFFQKTVWSRQANISERKHSNSLNVF